MKKNILNLFSITFLSLVLLLGCKKTDTTSTTTLPTDDAQTAQDDVYAQQAVSQTFSSVNNYGINDEGIKTRPYYITVDALSITGWPKKMTINFDAITAVDAALKNNRTGKLIAEFSGPWTGTPTAGTNVIVTFDNFVSNGIKYAGTLKSTYNGLNSAGGPSYTLFTNDLKFTFANNEFMTWATNRTVDWIAGFNANSAIADMKYLVRKDSQNSGINTKGSSYSTKVLSDIEITNCSVLPITKGILEITQSGSTKTLDFTQNANCSGKFKVTMTVAGILISVDLTAAH